jgi:hypothetical protein
MVALNATGIVMTQAAQPPASPQQKAGQEKSADRKVAK